ncbi:MAG: hypothetical protein CMJ46_09810 [Planctomyces sp.]|nr:hypothetical protein [Planctomyces sp.]
MKSSSDRKQLKLIDFGIHIASLVIVVVSVAGSYRLGYSDLQQQKQALNSERKMLQDVFESREEIAEEHRIAQEELQLQQQKLVDLLKRMPEQPKEFDFLAQITGLARTSNIRIQDYHPQQLTSGGEYRELKIKLNAHGSYVGLCTFLDEMHQLQRLNRVSQLTITPMKGNRQSNIEEAEAEIPQYMVSMQLHIYYMPVKNTDRIAENQTGGRG